VNPVVQRIITALFLTRSGAPRPTGCVCKGCTRDRKEKRK